jgi:hypothetical protein
MALMLPFGVFAVAGRFDQLRQVREHRRRIAARGRRLAQRQRHFAQRHRVAGQRVDQQQHVLAAVAEMGRDRVAQFGRHDAHHRRFVGRRHDQHGAFQAFGTERLLDEFAHLAVTLADQADHDHVGHGLARDQAEQHRFADAGTGHQADALALAEREHRIDRAHADVQRFVDRRLAQRVDLGRRGSGAGRRRGGPGRRSLRPGHSPCGPARTGRSSDSLAAGSGSTRAPVPGRSAFLNGIR